MLIEAKKVGCELDRSRSSQLFRYFNVTSTARIAFLTNGIRYEFYSDLDKSNIMDEKPFMIFDFETLEESLLPELQKLANDSFNIDTAAEELEAFMIVKAILRPHISVKKIAIRDKLSYCGVLYEDNNRKPICRFYFNSEKVKYLAVFNEEKQEIKYKIEKLDDIYNYSSELVKTVNMYIEPQE